MTAKCVVIKDRLNFFQKKECIRLGLLGQKAGSVLFGPMDDFGTIIGQYHPLPQSTTNLFQSVSEQAACPTGQAACCFAY